MVFNFYIFLSLEKKSFVFWGSYWQLRFYEGDVAVVYDYQKK